MAGSTNFQQWNPTQANQESDAAYASDSQRVGGAPTGSPLPAITGNKLFYQTSTGITALMEMMASKGFVVNDTNLATLASVLAAIQTTADLKNPMQSVTYSPSLVLNCATSTGFQISLSGNTSIALSGAAPGQIITILLVNDASGGHSVSFTGVVTGAFSPDQTANAVSGLILEADSTGANFRAISPMMSNTGINNTPIGQGTPATGTFTGLTAGITSLASATIAGLATILNLTVSGSASLVNAAVTGFLRAPTVAATDNSINVITSAWAKLGFSFSAGTTGFFKFPTWMGGFIIQWGTVTGNGSTAVFPTSFPNSLFGVWLTAQYNTAIDTNTRYVQVDYTSGSTPTNFGFQLVVSNGASGTVCNYLAIGN